jgi:hypothetical protein
MGIGHADWLVGRRYRDLGQIDMALPRLRKAGIGGHRLAMLDLAKALDAPPSVTAAGCAAFWLIEAVRRSADTELAGELYAAYGQRSTLFYRELRTRLRAEGVTDIDVNGRDTPRTREAFAAVPHQPRANYDADARACAASELEKPSP